MSTIEDFDRSVKTALGKGKPLSSSTVESLVKLAMANVAPDAQLVSTLYKHHKRCSSASKLYSLYLIDAIARDARSQAKKAAKGKDKQVSASASSSTAAKSDAGGTCATFLSKLEAVLSKLVVDCWENGQKEHREKVRKVLDIWSKAGTFSSSSLARINTKIAALDSGVSKDPSASPSVPKGSTTPTDAPPTTANGLPASVAALLTSSSAPQPSPSQSVNDEVERAIAAARAGVTGLPSPTPQPPPPSSIAFDPSLFDPAKLASLQQVLSGATNPTQSVPPFPPPQQQQQQQYQQSYGAGVPPQAGYGGGARGWEQGQQGAWGGQSGGGWNGQQGGGQNDGWGNGGGRGEQQGGRAGGWQGRSVYGQQEQPDGRQGTLNGHGAGQHGCGRGSFDGGRGGFQANRGGYQRGGYNSRGDETRTDNYSTGPSSREQSVNSSVDPRSRQRSPSPSSLGTEQPPRKRRWDAPADPPTETRAPLPSRPEAAASPPPDARPPPPSRPGGDAWDAEANPSSATPTPSTSTSTAAPSSQPPVQQQQQQQPSSRPRPPAQPLDFSLFDPTSPASWEAFAPMLLQMNGGVMPSTEFVIQWITWQMQMQQMQAMQAMGQVQQQGPAQNGEQGNEE